MYKKLHINLTFVFSVITSGILIIMSLFYLYLYEKDMTENSFLAFCSETASVLSGLEQQNEISLDWKSAAFSNKNFLPAFYDKDTLLSSCRLSLSSQEIALASEVKDYAFSLYPVLMTENHSYTIHKEFEYKHSGQNEYFVCALSLPKKSGLVTGIILYDTYSLRRQIFRQKIRFALLNTLGILCLFLFSWFFTGKLLAPIQASHEKQNAFIAAASHELRTPLAVILSSIPAYRQGTSEEREKFLNAIEMESKRMSLLVNDMLSLLRADNHTLALHLEPVEPDTLLLEVFEAFTPLVKEHHMHLFIRIPENSVRKCQWDKERINQVLAILVTNAISYGKKDGTITLGLGEEKNRMILWVKDNGPGIPDYDKPYIFDRFYRGDSSRSKKDHFGLGLSIAKEIIDAHHGKILIEDTSGGGASFFIILPIP